MVSNEKEGHREQVSLLQPLARDKNSHHVPQYREVVSSSGELGYTWQIQEIL